MKFLFFFITLTTLLFSCDKTIADSDIVEFQVTEEILNTVYKIVDTTTTLTVIIPVGNKSKSQLTRINSNNILNKHPFNAIKLCNIKSENNSIVYMGETGFTRDGSNGEVMVEIPKTYFKRILFNDYELLSLSATKEEGYIIDPAFTENGQELEHIYIGAYEGHVDRENKLRSITGVKPTTTLSLNNYRIAASRNGNGFGLFDARSLFLIQRLFMIYYADRNSQNVLGAGITNLYWQSQKETLAKTSIKSSNKIILSLGRNKLRHFKIGQYCAIAPQGQYSLTQDREIVNIRNIENNLTEITYTGKPVDIKQDISRIYGQAQKTGYTDYIISPNGSADYFENKHAGLDAVKFFNMENLWGNSWCMIDGLYVKNLRPHIGQNMSDYHLTENLEHFVPLNYTIPLQNTNEQNKIEESTSYIGQLGYDVNYPAYMVPFKIGETASPTTGYCDPFYSLNEAGKVYYAASGGGFDHSIRSGLFTLRIWFDNNQTAINLHGARLQYKTNIFKL